MNEWQETSMATLKPSDELSRSWPCRSSLGAKAIECRAMSRPPQVSAIRIEHRLEFALLADVARCDDGRPEIACERLYVGLRFLV